MTLVVRLLGPVQISRDDQPIAMRGYKPVALLAYLLVTGQAHTRQHLLDLLFDGPDDPKASLRWTLSELRQAIGAEYILADRQQIAFNFEGDYWLDVTAFEAGQTDLYQGDFLAGLNIRHAFGFEEWALFERERLRGVYQLALTRQLENSESSGDDQAVIETAHQLLRLDNLREEWYRALMRAYAWQGQREAALAQFELCRQVLQKELGIDPAAETIALAEAIRQGQIEITKSSTPPLPRSLAPLHTLGVPPQPTPFIGREEELAEIVQRLTNPACRLLTLVGPGGIGKTRLALEAATRLLPNKTFPGGVYFVPLASLSSSDFLISAIAGSLNFSFQSGKDPKAQLLNFLSDAKSALLLVLDNFEHLLTPQEEGKQGGADLALDILQTAPAVKLLVTSRERLNLREEWLFDIAGLQFPISLRPGEEVESYSAVQLFLQSAARLGATFALSKADKPYLVRICQLVEGMPLGLELAAAWVRVLSCQEIVQEIEKNLAFLTTSLRDMPARHRSLAAVFDHSWKLLSSEEQSVFRGLAVFRGGFWREAAEQVAGATLPLLSALVDKSFLRRNASGRYEIHELLRQYGAEKLAEAGEMEQIRDRHLAFFLELAEEAEPHLLGSDQATWLKRLEREHDNLRAAVEWSRTGEDMAQLSLRLTGSLASFWNGRSYMSEGREHLLAALSRPEASKRTAARAKALFEAGRLAFEQGDFSAVHALLEESMSIYRELGPGGRLGLAHALITLGDTEVEVGDYTTASPLVEEALGIMRELEEVSGIGRALWHLGWYALRQGDYEQASHYFEEALPLYRHLGDKDYLTYVLSGLGEIALRQGNYEHATALLEESLALRREFGINWGIAASLGSLGWVALRRGDLKQAVTRLVESLTLRREIGDRAGGMAWCLEKLAEIALTNGQRESVSRRDEDFQRAARLFGAAEALREPIGSVIDLVDQPEYERQLAILRAQLDEATFAAAWAEGRTMTMEQAIEYALTAKEAAISVPVPMVSERAVFVARERELAQLDGFLKLALAGQGRVVFVVSDAGNGKTTLVQEFSRRAQEAQPELIVAGGNCNAFTGVGDPYLPFREVLGLLTGDVEARWVTGAISQEQARRLWALMPHAVQTLVENGPDLVDIFISGPDLAHRAATAAPGGADWLSRLRQLVARRETSLGLAQLQQHNLFEQYTKVLQALARQQPILLVLDDLQWADTGSLNLLFHLGRRLKGQRILIVGIYRQADVALGRDGERHPLERVVNEFQRDFGHIHIDLNQTEGRSFVKALLASQPNQLGAAFQEALYQHVQGHALFTIEMLRGMQERGDLVQDEQGRWIEGPTLDWETLPARVEGVIGERIGRLPLRLQEILKVASVEGEFFTAEVIARVQKIDEPQVIRQLSGILDKHHRLVRSQSTRLLAVSGQRLSHYRFWHILFQRYLYHSLDEVERVYLHEAVGNVLEQLYEGQSEEVAVQLAWHFQMAGWVAKAVGYLYQAGERAGRLSAYPEAIAHFIKALELLETVSDPSQFAQQELNLQIALGHALIVVKGSASPKVEQAFVRARELCQQVEETPHLFKVLWGLWNFYLMQGETYKAARELEEQCLQLAQSLQDSALLVGAQLAQGVTLLYMGEELAPAQTHLEQGLALYQPQKHHALTSLYRQDPGVLCQRYLAWAKWFQGYPDQALEHMREALNLAQKLEHAYSIAGAQALACMLHYFRREEQAVKEWAEENITLSIEHGFLDWRLHGIMFRGWALAEQGQAEEGIEQIRQGLDAWYATGARSTALLAGVHLRIGQGTEGLTVLEKALTEVEKTGERFWEAELYRLKGELLLKAEGGGMKDENEVEAEKCFRQAIEVARRQRAKSLELRATVSLGRLWQRQGKKAEARRMLAKIYGWFTEGFDTVDLREAKALLEEFQ